MLLRICDLKPKIEQLSKSALKEGGAVTRTILSDVTEENNENSSISSAPDKEVVQGGAENEQYLESLDDPPEPAQQRLFSEKTNSLSLN